MEWNIKNGRVQGWIKENENDCVAPKGVGIKDGKVVSICFPDGISAIGSGLCEDLHSLGNH